MRKRIYDLISEALENDLWSKLYDIFMIFVILLSLIPLAFKEYGSLLKVIDYITAAIFIFDYLLRLITADFKLGKKGAAPFLVYPFTPMALIDLLAILPTLSPLSRSFKLVKLLKLLKFARVIKAINFLRHSKHVSIIENVFRKQKDPLTLVIIMAFAYITASALVVFNVEPDSFCSFFDAVYYATISLTSLGSAGVTLVSNLGRAVTMISSVLGVVIFALPAAILTAGYLRELQTSDENNEYIN